MSNAPRSLVSCLLVAVTLLVIRGFYSDIGGARPGLNITRWDAFGYYLYLPATTIFHDYRRLDWAGPIDARYNVTGGDGLPVQELGNGNRVCKYLGGVAILQAPFFVLGHCIAGWRGDPQDGFSPPYQYSLAIGALIYVFLALLLLRALLLKWFRDGTVAWTIALVSLATNLPQYAAVDAGLSHVWIFPLYAVVMFTTHRWHERPSAGMAFLTGLTIGLATICRPTEAIMLFIPLLWGLQDRHRAAQKWAKVRQHPAHVALAAAGGIVGILPQLLYWKAVTGSFIYDVGSKWVFLNPWFRVLAGWEKGWFVYTPVTILFVIGLFNIKRFAFRYPVLVFCLLNIWVIISWDDWQYGTSYSSRALVQSYPVFAFALAALLNRLSGHWRLVLSLPAAYLIGVNLFQIWQYNSGILHHRDMNRSFYSRIFLNPAPTAFDMSLLDSGDWPSARQTAASRIYADTAHRLLQGRDGAEVPLYRARLALKPGSHTLRVALQLRVTEGRWASNLGLRLREGDSVKTIAIRLSNPVGEKTGAYGMYMNVPATFRKPELELFLRPSWNIEATQEDLEIQLLSSGDGTD